MTIQTAEKVGKIYRNSLVASIKGGVEENKSTFLLSYSNVSSTELDEFRKSLREKGARVYASKNRLARIALKELEQEKLADCVAGQTVFVWSNEDSVLISKTIIEFTEKCETVLVKGGLLDGALLGKDDVKRLSDLPTKEVLQAQLLSTIIAPLTRLAGVLNAKSTELLSILKQLSEKKQEEGGK